MRGYSGSNTMPRPHSGEDINEIEQQRCIIERMDEETVNDRFEEMLVGKHVACTRFIYLNLRGTRVHAEVIESHVMRVMS